MEFQDRLLQFPGQWVEFQRSHRQDLQLVPGQVVFLDSLLQDILQDSLTLD